MRPRVLAPTSDGRARSESRLFNQVCPGVRVEAPARQEDDNLHPVFGSYVSAWEAWSVDPEIRFRGSSAGVLTALSTWLLESGQAHEVTGSASDPDLPVRTVPVRITSREEALNSAGSRYGPVGNLVSYRPSLGTRTTLVGKPCEVAAASRLHRAEGRPESSRPLMLSFFCAGTPSQQATDRLVQHLHVAPHEAKALWYRGRGWPGRFTVTSADGQERSLTYDESWGDHLGRDLQWRCKLCVDGTGGHADVSVGDYWNAGDDGYPSFDDAEGISVVIARTRRGHDLLVAAQQAGILQMRALDLELVANVQPLQVDRRLTLVGRLLGRRLALKPPPRYRGYGLMRGARARPKGNVRATLGTLKRSLW